MTTNVGLCCHLSSCWQIVRIYADGAAATIAASIENFGNFRPYRYHLGQFVTNNTELDARLEIKIEVV
jgi:hypothetical protein